MRERVRREREKGEVFIHTLQLRSNITLKWDLFVNRMLSKVQECV